MDIPNEHEVKVRSLLQKIGAGELPPVSDELIEEAGEQFKKSLRKQFTESRKGDFTLRMSNLGRPTCQLWFQKHYPDMAEDKSYDFVMRMLIGDAVEVLSLFAMKLAGVPVESVSGKVSMELDGDTINGEYDVIIDGKVWDVKSASPYSYQNKFKDFTSICNDDPFGYVSQGFAYSKATGVPFGGWIVVNKSTGEIKFVEAQNEPTTIETVEAKMVDTKRIIASDKPLERCFEDVEETYRKQPTGNRHLSHTCSYCDYKYKCWDNLQFKPSTSSTAKTKPWKYYTVYNEPDAE
jgi:hypothetical protein